MKVTKISYGETIPNPKVQYASLRPEFEIELQDGEDPLQAIEYAKQLCHDAVQKVLEIDDFRHDSLGSLAAIHSKLNDLQNQYSQAKQKWVDYFNRIQSLTKDLEPPDFDDDDDEDEIAY